MDDGSRLLGSSIGNYRLERVVGRGGMGIVYGAVHIYLDREVALKVLHQKYAARAEAAQRFLHEARAASTINHPNIVEVLDFGPTPDGRVYLAMELLHGRDLETQLDIDRRMTLHRAINIVYQIASALHAAHEKGIVHNDLKPANVMLLPRLGRRELLRQEGERLVVEPEGVFDFVKLLDFGVARMGGATQENEPIFGTPQYMTPEAACGSRVNARSDIYSLGVLFYEMLTGKVPFDGEDASELLNKHIHEAPPSPRELAPEAEISPGAETLILRSLAKDPAQRPQTMDEVKNALSKCYGSVAYRRDADHVPGAAEQGLLPKRRRLTEELDAWLSTERQRIERALRDAREEPDADEPLLLTERKPI